MACPVKPGASGSPMTTSEPDTEGQTFRPDAEFPQHALLVRKALCLQVYAHTKEWPGRELLSEP